jgi:hypothetical protein
MLVKKWWVESDFKAPNLKEPQKNGGNSGTPEESEVPTPV